MNYFLVQRISTKDWYLFSEEPPENMKDMQPVKIIREEVALKRYGKKKVEEAIERRFVKIEDIK